MAVLPYYLILTLLYMYSAPDVEEHRIQGQVRTINQQEEPFGIIQLVSINPF
jgi:hypothetical protein